MAASVVPLQLAAGGGGEAFHRRIPVSRPLHLVKSPALRQRLLPIDPRLDYLKFGVLLK